MTSDWNPPPNLSQVPGDGRIGVSLFYYFRGSKLIIISDSQPCSETNEKLVIVMIAQLYLSHSYSTRWNALFPVFYVDYLISLSQQSYEIFYLHFTVQKMEALKG